VTTGTLPHSAYSPDLAPSDFHLFSSLKVYVGGKIFRADDDVNFCAMMADEQPQTFLKEA